MYALIRTKITIRNIKSSFINDCNIAFIEASMVCNSKLNTNDQFKYQLNQIAKCFRSETEMWNDTTMQDNYKREER